MINLSSIREITPREQAFEELATKLSKRKDCKRAHEIARKSLILEMLRAEVLPSDEIADQIYYMRKSQERPTP